MGLKALVEYCSGGGMIVGGGGGGSGGDRIFPEDVLNVGGGKAIGRLLAKGAE